MRRIIDTPRKLAWKALLQYQKTQKDPDELLNEFVIDGMSERDKALAWEITKGSIRYLRKLDHVAQAYIRAPIRTQKAEVVAALRAGLYQLTEMSGVPSFAAVDETVAILSDAGLKRDAGFVNAVLRSFLRESEKISFPDPDAEPLRHLSILYSFPEWLVRRWMARFGFDETRKLLTELNQRPQVSFRMLGNSITRDEAIEKLASLNIKALPGKYLPEYLWAENGQEVIKSDLFPAMIVQDESQGIALRLLDPPRGSVALDLCSAPGGKTVALAELVGPQGKVISVDKDRLRLKQVEGNIKRTKLENVEIICQDILEFAPSGKLEYIILDVPCTGFGTLPRNVDLKWSKRESDIQAMAELQGNLLDKSSELLADGGRLVYSTCTTEPEEIEEVIGKFLRTHADFQLHDSDDELLQLFRVGKGTYRTWPHKHGIGAGGFVLLRKVNEDQ